MYAFCPDSGQLVKYVVYKTSCSAHSASSEDDRGDGRGGEKEDGSTLPHHDECHAGPYGVEMPLYSMAVQISMTTTTVVGDRVEGDDAGK